MASLYKNNGVWYISCTYNSKRKSKSLKTSDIRVAKRLKPHVESQLLLELSGVRTETVSLDFPALARVLHFVFPLFFIWEGAFFLTHPSHPLNIGLHSFPTRAPPIYIHKLRPNSILHLMTGAF